MSRPLAVVQKDEMAEKGLAVLESIKSVVIRNQTDYDQAATMLVDVKTKIKEVDTALDPQVKAAHNAWQVALKQKKEYLKPYEDAETALKTVMATYQREQKRLADEAAEKARIAAEKQEAKERAALERQAAKKEAKGDTDAATELRQQAETVFVPVVAPTHEVTKSQGTSSTNKIKVEVLDLGKFLPWLVESGLDLSTVVTVKVGAIESYAKLTKAKTIPGCRVYEDVVISASGRK